MATNPIQTRFDGGETTPRLGGRFDTDLYKRALAYCRNFVPLAHGSLLMRAGTEDTSKLYGGPSARIINFSADGQDYTIEFSNLQTRIYAQTGAEIVVGGEVTPPPDPEDELVTNGVFADGTGWHKIGDPDLVVFAAGIATLKYDWTYNAQERFWFDSTGAFDQPLAFTQGGQHRISYKVGGISAGETIGIQITQAGATIYAASHTAGGTYSSLFNAQAGPATLLVWCSGESHFGGSVNIDNISIVFGGTDDPSLDAVFASPWTIDQVEAIQFDAEPSKSRIVLAHGNVPTQVLTRNTLGQWTLAPAAFTAKPAEWAGTNWPSVVAIHAGRLYLGATPNEPSRMWASKAGSLFDFTLASGSGGESLPGDAIDVQVATKGRLQWMQEANRALMVGTEIAEHSISGSQGVPLVGDIQILKESTFGSGPVQAVDADDLLLFVTEDRRRIRAFHFNRNEGWQTKDLTFLCEHLTEGLIKEVHYLRGPDRKLAVLMRNGDLLLMTFDASEGIAAAFRVEIAGGTVRSACASRNYLWLAVDREGAMRLERLPLTESLPLRYLDSSLAGVSDANGQVSGLTHLEGKVVGVTAGAALLGDFPVVDGKVQLGVENANAQVNIGLRYSAKAITNPKDTRGGKTRSPKVGMILNDSALPSVNGKRPADRTHATAMGSGEPLRNGKFEVGLLGWSEDGKITIEQDLPFRTEVLALFETTQVNEQ